MGLFSGVDRLEKKRDKIHQRIADLQQQIQEARENGDKDKAQKLDHKRKHLMGRMRWYDERIENERSS